MMLITRFLSTISIALSMLGQTIGSQCRPVLAPSEPGPPLYQFFQQNFDSTIVYQQYSPWNSAPNMLILSKKGQQFYFFTYRSPYQSMQGRYVPGGLVHRFSNLEAKFRSTPPDTNQYLLFPPIPISKLEQTWRSLHPAQLWYVYDDDTRTANSMCRVEDGETVKLWFLTKSGARSARFYAPDFYEACEGVESNRKQAIKARNTLEALLKP